MNVREVALECLLNISQTRISIVAAIDKAFQKQSLNGRECRLLNALVYGVVRWQKQLDWVLNHFINPRFRLDTRHSALLRLGAFQLLHLDGIPAHAAIFETVQLAKGGRKARGFINAILRKVEREAQTLTYPSFESNPIEHISFSLSYPKWLVSRWIKTRGIPWTLAFCQASNEIAPLAFRVNSFVKERDRLRESLRANGLSTKVSRISPDGLVLLNREDTGLASGSSSLKSVLNTDNIYVQDESAMLVAPLVAPKNAQIVVDLCAAPGGKTTHLASLMSNSGKIIAVDISDKRLALLKENCRRMGTLNVETQVLDATKANLSFIANADAVLIDTPCSGFGTLRRHPDIRWNKTPEQLRSLCDIQYSLLKNAASYLKPGAVLVYSTCSIEPMENEELIRRFLADFPMYAIEHAHRFLTDVPQSAITQDGFLQTFPHEHGVDGAFAARLRRKGSRGENIP